MRALYTAGLSLPVLALAFLTQPAQADPSSKGGPLTQPAFVRPVGDFPPERAEPLVHAERLGRAVLTVVNDTDDQMVIHINDENAGWLRPRETRDFPLTQGKTVVSANSHDGDVYVHTFDNPRGFVVWYINEGH